MTYGTRTGFTGRDYRRNLPKGVQRQEGDVYIAKGQAYKLVSGIGGKYALRDLLTGFEGEAGFDRTLSMIHVAPGEQITVGDVGWDVVRLDGETVTVSMKTPQSTQVREVHALALATEIQAAMDAVARAASYRAGLRDTVLRHLQAAQVDYTSLMYDTDKARDGIIVNGIDKDELPPALALLAELPGAVVVTLKSEAGKSEDGEESDMEHNTQTGMGELPPFGDLPPILVALADTLQTPESATEIKTFVHWLDESDNDFVLPPGWNIENITISQGPMTPNDYRQEGEFVTINLVSAYRVITISRVSDTKSANKRSEPQSDKQGEPRSEGEG